MYANINFAELSKVSQIVSNTQRQMREAVVPILELQSELQRIVQPSQEYINAIKQIRDIQTSIASIDLSHINSINERVRQSTINISNMIPSSLFQFDTIDEAEEYLDTGKGIDDLQLAYDSVSSISESLTDEDTKTDEETKSVSVKAMTISERINTLFVILQMIQLIYSFFGDNTGEHIENISKANNQIIQIEQQQYDEQVRHNKAIEEIEGDKNESLKKLADELELSNNLKQKSDAD